MIAKPPYWFAKDKMSFAFPFAIFLIVVYGVPTIYLIYDMIIKRSISDGAFFLTIAGIIPSWLGMWWLLNCIRCWVHNKGK